MNEFELTRAVHSLVNWRPPQGIGFRVMLAPEPGLCRVRVFLSADGERAIPVEIREPPSPDQLAALTVLAQEILLDTRDPVIDGPNPGQPQVKQPRTWNLEDFDPERN